MEKNGYIYCEKNGYIFYKDSCIFGKNGYILVDKMVIFSVKTW